MSWTWLVLLIFTSLTTFRLTRLIVEDDFPLVRVPREWVIGKPRWKTIDPTIEGAGQWVQDKHEGRWYYWFGELISCPWCASGWIALGLIVAVAVSNKQGSLVEWFLLWVASWALGSTAAAKIK